MSLFFQVGQCEDEGVGGVLRRSLYKSSGREWFWFALVGGPAFCNDSCLLSLHDSR